MNLLEAEQKLLNLRQPVLQTNDVVACLRIEKTHASKILQRLVSAGRFVHLRRGRWATSQQIDPLILPEYLTAPFPSYISLQTALFYYGMISQIPHTIYAVTLARTKQYKTPLGFFSVHHIQPDFFFDFTIVGNVKIASPEKALLDVLYLTPARSNLFKTLPEIELTSQFNFKKAHEIINKIPSFRRKALVLARFKKLIEG